MKNHKMIGLGTFFGLTVVWYLFLSNAHLLDIFPCTEVDYGSYTSSTTCELIDVTRQASFSGAELTVVGYVLAAVVVFGLPAGIAAFVSHKMKK